MSPDRNNPASLFEKMLKALAKLFGNPKLSVFASLQSELPITLSEPLVVPVKGKFDIDLEDYVQVDGIIPVQASIPVDTTVETEILKFGKVKIPIKATIPISVSVPISTRVKIRIKGLSVELDKNLEIELPTLLIPLDSTLQTQVSLLDSGATESAD